jgi:hypothetical protein
MPCAPQGVKGFDDDDDDDDDEMNMIVDVMIIDRGDLKYS